MTQPVGGTGNDAVVYGTREGRRGKAPVGFRSPLFHTRGRGVQVGEGSFSELLGAGGAPLSFREVGHILFGPVIEALVGEIDGLLVRFVVDEPEPALFALVIHLVVVHLPVEDEGTAPL